jgi:hypothetical protein
MMNSSAKSDLPIEYQHKEKHIIIIPKKHHIFGAIIRIGFFKTETSINLESISRLGITFSSACHSLTKAMNKNVMIELYIDGKLFVHNAYIVSHDVINELYEMKFSQSFEYIDKYLEHLNTSPRYGLNTSPASDGSMNLKAIA